jgi:hypothetical protein
MGKHGVSFILYDIPTRAGFFEFFFTFHHAIEPAISGCTCHHSNKWRGSIEFLLLSSHKNTVTAST